jgi:hypothetical protein
VRRRSITREGEKKIDVSPGESNLEVGEESNLSGIACLAVEDSFGGEVEVWRGR